MTVALSANEGSTLPSRLPYWLSVVFRRVEFTAGRITLLYLAFGFAALYLSDVVFVRVFEEPFLSRMQAVKGGVEVLVTGGLIYLLTAISRSQLQAKNERLREQRRELEVLHRVFRHNLRNDLTVLRGYAEHVRENVGSDELASDCDTIVETSDTITDYTEQTAKIRQLSGPDDTKSIDVVDCLPRLVETHDLLTDAVDVTLRLPDSAPVSVLPEFEDAMRELLANAIEHTDGDPEIEIAVDPDAGPPNTTEVRVEDDGPGIPDAELEALATGEAGQIAHGSGLGLWFVYWTVKRSGGEISFEERDSGGTCVRVHLPDGNGLSERFEAI